jgi:hypothetical protein
MFNENNVASLIGNKNIIALINGSDYWIDGFTWINGRTMTIPKNIEPSAELLDDFYYSLAKYYLQEEDVDNYEYILGLLGDTGLFESTQNCYSFLEKGNAVNKVAEAYENKALRFAKGRKPIDSTSASEKLCVLEILDRIMQDKDSMLYWDLQTPYRRITQATVSDESRLKFIRDENGLIPVANLSVGSEKLNIGIKVKISGVVKDMVSGLTKEASVYRDFNLINSGNVNVGFINCKLSEELYQDLFMEGILEVNKQYSFVGGVTIYKINLEGIKSANKRILKSMSMTQIFEYLKSIEDLKCRQHALNKLVKEVLGDKDRIEFSDKLSFEEVELRKLFNIDENGIYVPEHVEKDEVSNFEIYPAIFSTWSIKFPDKKIKEQYYNQYFSQVKIQEGNKESYDKLSKMLSEVKSELAKKNFAVNCSRIASSVMNKSPFVWTTEVEKDKKKTDKILQQNMIVTGKVRVSSKVFEDTQDILEQHRWIELIKCS